MTSAMTTDDGSVVMGGYNDGDWVYGTNQSETVMVAAKVAANGTLLWQYQVIADRLISSYRTVDCETFEAYDLRRYSRLKWNFS